MAGKKWEDYCRLVKLGETSELKLQLNHGIASLSRATEPQFKPWVCLNDLNGIKVIRQISQDPDNANTEISLGERINHGGGDQLWLNVAFSVYLKELSSNSHVFLTPRQTSYMVCNLPPDLQKIVLEKVARWICEYFKETLINGLARIEQQITEDKLLLKDSHFNRVFDLRSDDKESIHNNFPYTEMEIVGEKLFWQMFFSVEDYYWQDEEKYRRLDQMIISKDRQTKQRAEEFVGAIRTLHSLLDD